MTYTIEIDPDALSDMESLPKKIRRQVDKKILGLANNPKPAKAIQLKGDENKGIWRLRSGDYRIIYEIQNDTLVVFVVLVGNRKEIYKRLKRILSQP